MEPHLGFLPRALDPRALCLPHPDSLSQVPLNRWSLRGLIFPSKRCCLPSGGFRLNAPDVFVVGNREAWAAPNTGYVWPGIGTHISTVESSCLPWARTSRITGSYVRAKGDKMRTRCTNPSQSGAPDVGLWHLFVLHLPLWLMSSPFLVSA